MNVYKKQLKKFGMQDEYENWKKNILLEPKVLKVGSKIRVNEAGCGFLYTSSGSEGIINSLSDTHARIKFYKLTGEPLDDMDHIFSIGRKYLELI